MMDFPISQGMHRTMLNKHSYIIYSFIVPGDRLRPSVRIEVNATNNVSVYVVDGNGLNDFQNIKQFRYYNGRDSTFYFNEKFNLPLPGTYNLLIVNRNQFPVDVSYGAFV